MNLERNPKCPFEAIVLLPLGPNRTYDGRSQPAWISLSDEGEVLAITFKKGAACPPWYTRAE